ncbi:transcriptional regulator with XRE-family HTH domain [Caulobacter ginsengisoli]|uniref:Transcriptional regulator with XRE-family HTH domain n=1 Tax=Caulobacter ginsengisoli TaxID=400775 RepID=A0ABU0ITC5_9CAUL|nr:helix-turn-helix domain-containing protein [Caulobacter ginsengisoli]MDQ0464222.1 transcriptional regulator with XRE-family HTH domain [Caulobacter ginsengisoli]
MARIEDQIGPDPLDIEVGARIRLRRKTLGISQQQLAKHLNLTFQQVQKYEKGVNRISASMLIRTAEKLECSAAFLLGEEDQDRAAKSVAIRQLASPKAFELLEAFSALPDSRTRGAVLALTRALAGQEAAVAA